MERPEQNEGRMLVQHAGLLSSCQTSCYGGSGWRLIVTASFREEDVLAGTSADSRLPPPGRTEVCTLGLEDAGMQKQTLELGLWLSLAFAAFAANAAAADAKVALGANLEVEDLGEPVRAATMSNVCLFRHPQTDELHLTGYIQAFTGLGRGTDPPFQIYDLNLGTGQARIVQGMEGRPGPNATIVHSSGKLYMGTSRPPAFLEYDPRTGVARKVGEMSDNYFHGAQMIVEGGDGAAYVGLMGYHVSRYDPKTGDLEDLGVMGAGGYGSYGYVYSLQADDRYVYCGVGQMPWYLVIYDRRAKTQRSFFRTQEGEPNPYGGVQKTLDGRLWYERGGDWYELKGGEPVRTEQRPRRLERRGRICEPQEAPKQFALEVDVSQIAPTGWNHGAVVVRWRKVGEEPWRTSSTQGANVRPNAVKRLVALPDGTLLGFAAFYGPMFLFDPKSATATCLGHSPGSIYDMLAHGDRVFISGYSSMFCDYDLAKPWTLSRLSEQYSKADNPKRVPLQVTGKYNYFLARGADGRIYIGEHHERADTGGSVGWYDPKTGESGGLRQEFLQHDVCDICAVNDGALIAIGAAAIDEDGESRLVALDVATQAIVQDFTPLAGERSAGNLMPAGKDAVLGVVAHSAENPQGVTKHRAVLYKANLRTGEVLWKKTAEGRFLAGPLEGDFPAGDRRITLGPDGCGWLFVDQTLSRIHPDDGKVEAVLQCDVAGRLLFIGRDLYLYNGGRQYFGGFAGIKRIRSVLVPR
jgi:outer membrane protein assembly factor BamB